MTHPLHTIDLSIDHHVHTSYCGHAIGKMEDYVLAGINKGLAKIIFLEHMEAGIDYFERTWLTDQDFDHYFKEGRKLQRHYQGQIEIGLGVEVGYNPEYRNELITRLKQHNWDQIGLSFHYLPVADKPNGHRHLNLVSRKPANIKAMQAADPDQTLSHYFAVLKEAVQTLNVDHICHLDAALRFVPGLHLTDKHHQQITSLLDLMADHNVALEINTSGFVIRDRPYPDCTIINQAATRNIPLLASSDAHRPEDVGRLFNRLPDYLESCRSTS
ncbi:MAG: histidinol-phosphatase [Desulfobulbaceae bacterium]|uniref:Histidinol-phosphatase n=1 Tax=Candidatus Desulfatifera sulfidica TaxID=2841691 RepID=A0A8J6N7N1_9BACT|nr:histidinol-phosphatase [Candidatus Desulfatifera sulfidica]